MIVFGITGGTGAGKTSALRVLAELGAYLIDCDALYYEMLRPGTALHEDIGTAFGRDMFDASGALNRQKLGSLVFSAPQELQRLNGIIYSHLGRRSMRAWRGSAAHAVLRWMASICCRPAPPVRSGATVWWASSRRMRCGCAVLWRGTTSVKNMPKNGLTRSPAAILPGALRCGAGKRIRQYNSV